MPPASQERSFFAHLHELRGRLLKMLAVLALCSCVMYAFRDPLLWFLLKPVGRLVFTSPEEAFNARMMLAVMGGFLLAFYELGIIFSRFMLKHGQESLRIPFEFAGNSAIICTAKIL